MPALLKRSPGDHLNSLYRSRSFYDQEQYRSRQTAVRVSAVGESTDSGEWGESDCPTKRQNALPCPLFRQHSDKRQNRPLSVASGIFVIADIATILVLTVEMALP